MTKEQFLQLAKQHSLGHIGRELPSRIEYPASSNQYSESDRSISRRAQTAVCEEYGGSSAASRSVPPDSILASVARSPYVSQLMPTPLPESLRYLEVALRGLSALPSQELNEDADVTELESALRERVKGLTIREAQARIAEDAKALKAWLKRAGDNNGSGAWIVSFLSYRPGALARSLLTPPVKRPTRGAHETIIFETPEGWTPKPDDTDSSLTLRNGGKEVGSIASIKISSIGYYERQLDAAFAKPSHSEVSVKSSVQFGECHGQKYSYVRTAPIQIKSLRYILEVPGGAVEAVLGSEPGGTGFDEAAFEEKLHTLRIVPVPE